MRFQSRETNERGLANLLEQIADQPDLVSAVAAKGAELIAMAASQATDDDALAVGDVIPGGGLSLLCDGRWDLRQCAEDGSIEKTVVLS